MNENESEGNDTVPDSSEGGHGVTTAAGIQVRQLRVSYGNGARKAKRIDAGTEVLSGIDLECAPGEIIAVLGPSGCGKSTLLKAIAGLLPISGGDISFVGRARRKGDLSYVFQDPTLLPWRTVRENVGLPFELGSVGPKQNLSGQQGESIESESQANARLHEQTPSVAVEQALRSVGLEEQVFSYFPRQLSGGMRMRVSIARALVTDPSILLLDEPFAALDDILRTRLNDLVLELWSARQRTIMFVTHNIAEAVYLSHRIVVVSGGAVAKSIKNPLEWPRQAAVRSSLPFAEFYGSVSQALAEAVGK